MRRQSGLCHYCGQPMWSGDPAHFRAAYGLSQAAARLFRCTAEHLTPRCAGGTDGSDNLVAACWFCNVTRHRRKRPLEPDAYRAMVRRRLAAGRWRHLPAPKIASDFQPSFEGPPLFDRLHPARECGTLVGLGAGEERPGRKTMAESGDTDRPTLHEMRTDPGSCTYPGRPPTNAVAARRRNGIR